MAPKSKTRAKSKSAGPSSRNAAGSGGAKAKAKASSRSATPEQTEGKERAEARLRDCLAEPNIAQVDGRVLEIAILDGKTKAVDSSLLKRAEERYEDWKTFEEDRKKQAEVLRQQIAEAIAEHDVQNEAFHQHCKARQTLKKRIEQFFSAIEDSELEKVRKHLRECTEGSTDGPFPTPVLPIDVEDHEGNTALSEAATYGELDIVRLLIEEGANLDSINTHGKSPLYRATYNGHDEVVDTLLKAGADPKAGDFAAGEFGTDATKRLISEWTSDKKDEAREGLTELQTLSEPWPRSMLKAAQTGNVAALQALLKKVLATPGMPPATRLRTIIDFENMADAFWVVCTAGHEEAAKMLFDMKADIDCCSHTGLTPLMVACRKGHTSVVKLLLENGAKTYLRSDEGSLAIHHARRAGHNALASVVQEHCKRIKEWSTLQDSRGEGESSGCPCEETRKNAMASNLATAELRAMDPSEIRNQSDRYRQLLEERALADVLGLG